MGRRVGAHLSAQRIQRCRHIHSIRNAASTALPLDFVTEATDVGTLTRYPQNSDPSSTLDALTPTVPQLDELTREGGYGAGHLQQSDSSFLAGNGREEYMGHICLRLNALEDAGFLAGRVPLSSLIIS